MKKYMQQTYATRQGVLSITVTSREHISLRVGNSL